MGCNARKTNKQTKTKAGGMRQRKLQTLNAINKYPGRDISVGIATSYRLHGLGIESRWRRNFLHPSRPFLGPTRSVALTTHHHLLSRLKKEYDKSYLYL
jgi:hypothetical protein